jgi:hypothetical protein
MIERRDIMSVEYLGFRFRRICTIDPGYRVCHLPTKVDLIVDLETL